MNIYKVFLKTNPNEAYVGKTKNHIQVRLYQHWADRRKQRWITGVSEKMKEHDYNDFEIELLEVCDDCIASQREQHFIELFGTWNLTNSTAQPQQYVKKRRLRTEEQKKQHADEEKERYKKNKEKILTRMFEPVLCECGMKSTKGHLKRHQKTKNHLDKMKPTLSASISDVKKRFDIE